MHCVNGEKMMFGGGEMKLVILGEFLLTFGREYPVPQFKLMSDHGIEYVILQPFKQGLGCTQVRMDMEIWICLVLSRNNRSDN